MSNQDDRWLWLIDDEPLQALLKAEGEVGTMRMRAASSPGLVRAMTSHMEGRTSEAAAELTQAIENGETQPESFLFLGQLQFEAGQFEDALAVYARLLEIDPEHALAAFNAGVCHEKASRWNDAAELFNRSLQIDAGHPEAWLGLALACLHLRRADEALHAFDRFLEHEPESEPALFGRAVALQMLRRFDEAAAIYDRFRTEGEPSAELTANLWTLAVARQDPAELSRIASELARLWPGSRQTLEAQAYSDLITGDWTGAARNLALMAEKEPLAEDWAYARAYASWRSGDTAAAKSQIEAILGQRSDHGPALLLRGVLLEGEGLTAESLAAYRAAARQTPDSEAAWWNVARLSASKDQAGVCRQAAKTLLNRNRNSAESAFAHGLASAAEGKPADAEPGFSDALRLRAGWPEAEWNLGLALLDTGAPEKALPHLEKGFEGLQSRVSPLPLAQAALQSGSPERALAVLESSGFRQASPDFLYNLAVAFQENAQFGTAARLYRLAIGAGAAFADAHVNLGHILLAEGRPEEAEAMWKEGSDLETAAA